MKGVGILAILLLLTTAFAAPPIVESGDGGEQFAEDTAKAKCLEEDVQAVYHCLGNIVRVVSAIEGEGSTFYKPDGRVIHCPVVEPTDMGAECLQMLTPNYCPVQAECGAAPVPQVFPGQNDTPEQTGDEDYYIIEGEAASDELEEVPEPEPEPEPEPKKEAPEPVKNELEIPAANENKVDSMLGDLSLAIVLMGIFSLAVLFLLFKKSMNGEY